MPLHAPHHARKHHDIVRMLTPPIIWKRSSRAQHITLRVDVRRNALVVTLPSHISHQQGVAFLHTQSEWIQTTLRQLPPSALETGTIMIKGQTHPILFEPPHGSQQIWLDHQGLHLRHSTAEKHTLRLKTFLHHLAMHHIPPLVWHHAARMNLTPTHLRIRDVYSRWGSCTQKGRLMLSWRLILAPPSICTYVIIHELSHLQHFNHSQRFWQHVDQWCPGGKKERLYAEKWLKHHGITLLRMI